MREKKIQNEQKVNKKQVMEIYILLKHAVERLIRYKSYNNVQNYRR